MVVKKQIQYKQHVEKTLTFYLVEQKTEGKENFHRKMGEENYFSLFGSTKENVQKKKKCVEKVGMGPAVKILLLPTWQKMGGK